MTGDAREVLAVQGIRKHYGATCVIDDVSFSVREGALLCIVGPSGCGKSTLLNCVAGLESLAGGRVLLNGREVSSPTPECGVVFQEYALFPWLTVYENVEYGLRAQGLRSKTERRARVEHYIELVGLAGFAGYYPKHLSGGMRQRLAIARSLVVEPKVMLMDEPFAAVDAFTRRRLQNELIRIWQETQMTIIFITHSLPEAVLLGDEIICLTRAPASVTDSIRVTANRPRDVDVPHDPDVLDALQRVNTAVTQGAGHVAEVPGYRKDGELQRRGRGR
jgi:NitT/TauT family transport system ATP-binding protein